VRFFQEYLSDKAAISAVNDVRRRLYDHVLHIPMGFFGLKGTSDVTSRLVQDAQGLQDGFKTVLGQSIQEPIRAALMLGFAFFLSWKLTLFIILFAPVMAMAIRKFGKKMRRASRAALQNSSTMLGQIEGTLIGIRVVKAAGAERFERRRYGKILEALRIEQLKMARYEAFSTPTLETLATLVVGCVLIYASYLVLVLHTLDTTTFFMVMACLVGIGESLRKVSKVNNVLQRSNAAAARIFETMDVPIERSRALALARYSGEGRVEVLSRVTTAGDSAGDPLRERHVLISECDDACGHRREPDRAEGPIGRNRRPKRQRQDDAGRAAPALLRPAGRARHNRRHRYAPRHAALAAKTDRIVTQDSVIFPGTIADNIAYGLPLVTREQVVAAAKRAFCHDFIMEKLTATTVPRRPGLATFRRPKAAPQHRPRDPAQGPILILDEATSQVDAESEHLIQQAIESLMHEATTFVIAHRFSTITSADTIVVMDRGRIVGQGAHDELCARARPTTSCMSGRCSQRRNSASASAC
jgi:ABC-type multidrug transport system fused ATPase/permease subunit